MEYLVHHGILGQKWGVRRFQNKDGSLTSAGKEKIGRSERKARAYAAGEAARRAKIKELNESPNKHTLYTYNREAKKARLDAERKSFEEDRAYNKSLNQGLSDKQKKALKVGAAVAGTALAAYGAYKVSSMVKENVYQHNKAKARKAVFNAVQSKKSVDTINGLINAEASIKRESLGKSISKTVSNNRVGNKVDYKNVYKILSGTADKIYVKAK